MKGVFQISRGTGKNWIQLEKVLNKTKLQHGCPVNNRLSGRLTANAKRTTLFMCSVTTIKIIYAFYIWKSLPLSHLVPLVFLSQITFIRRLTYIIFV